MDLFIYGTILLFFATWFTSHVLLCVRIAQKALLRGLVAFILPIFAPIWGLNFHIRTLPGIWVLSAVFYGFALLAGVLGSSI